MPYAYILYSKSLDKYYIGSTDKTVEERLTKHMTNHGGFTAKAKDWEIVCKSFHETLSGARIQEMSIKKAKSRKVIAALVEDFKKSQSG